jgi:transposase
MNTPSTTTPLIGLDIGKNVHVYGTYRSEDLAPLGEPVTILNNRAGFSQFAAHIAGLLAHYPLVKVANEPTGIYYEAFGRQLLSHFAAPLGHPKV